MPLTYNRHEISIFESKLENVLFEGCLPITVKSRDLKRALSNAFHKMASFPMLCRKNVLKCAKNAARRQKLHGSRGKCLYILDSNMQK